MNKAEIAIIKELRGSILKFLQDCYPHIMARDSLIATYYEYEKVDDICDAIEYLKEKGYVDEKKLEAPFADRFHYSSFYRITVKGIDLVEGTVTDAGICLPQEV